MEVDLAQLPSLSQLPSLTCLSLQAARYTCTQGDNSTGASMGAGVLSALPAAAVEAAGAALGMGPGEASALASAAAAARGPAWPPAPPRLQRLRLHITDSVPPDALRQLLPPPAAPQQAPSGAAPSAANPAQAPASGLLPLRELVLLPHALAGSGSARAALLDLSPLLAPHLAGVTRLVLPTLQQRALHAPGVQGAAGQGAQAGPEAAPRDAAALLGRLTHLRSLTLLEQVELGSFAPVALAPLAALQELRLAGGVFCEAAAELGVLRPLTRLSLLELNFGTEWWLDAADLRALSSLSALRELRLAIDYGLADEADADELSSDDLNDDGTSSGHGGTSHGGCELGEDEDTEQEGGGTDLHARAATRSHAAAAAGMNTLAGLRRTMLREWRAGGGAGGAHAGNRRGSSCSGGAGGGAGGDDWRMALCRLTQLRRLGLSLRNGGGEHLAAALHASATWLGGGGSGGGGGGGAAGDWGVSLSLHDTTAATLLDVPYWAKATAPAAPTTAASAAVAGGSGAPPPAAAPPPTALLAPAFAPLSIAAAAGGSTTSIAASLLPPKPPPPTTSPPVPAAPPATPLFVAAPLVSLHLGSGRDLSLGPAQLLCLGLLTDLRSLSLSFEALPSALAGPHRPSTLLASPQPPANPLRALSRLHHLRVLTLRIKQPHRTSGSARNGSSGAGTSSGSSSRGRSSDGAGGPGADEEETDRADEAGRDGLEGTVAALEDGVVASWLQAIPRLEELDLRGEGRLGEEGLGAVGRHGALRTLRLRLKLPHEWAEERRREASSRWCRPYGDCTERLALGYGSLYALTVAAKAAAASASAAQAGGGAVVGSFNDSPSPFGMSPPGPGMLRAFAAAAGPQSAGATVPTVPLPMQSAGAGAAEGPAAPSLVRDRMLEAGVEGGSDLLAGLPLFLRPHHLPPSLTSLDLTNAAFSAEWAQAQAQAQSGPTAASGTGSTSSPAPARTARLVSLRLAHVRPKAQRWRSGRGGAVGGAGKQQPTPETFFGAGRGADPAGVDSSAGRDPQLPDGRCITDWHLACLLGRPAWPCLAHLTIVDEDPAGGKLHHRALAALSRLSYLQSINLAVGDRLRWSAQEALLVQLPGGLRRLRLHASNLYAEAVEGASRLTNLAALQISGCQDPSYAPVLAAAVRGLGPRLPGCTLVVHIADPAREEGQQAGQPV